MSYFNRYRSLIQNGQTETVPFIKLPINTTDKSKVWNKQTDRLDVVSYKYYGHPYGGFLILMANAEFGVEEEDIPDAAQIRIPFPYNTALQQYIDGLDKYLRKYRR